MSSFFDSPADYMLNDESFLSLLDTPSVFADTEWMDAPMSFDPPLLPPVPVPEHPADDNDGSDPAAWPSFLSQQEQEEWVASVIARDPDLELVWPDHQVIDSAAELPATATAPPSPGTERPSTSTDPSNADDDDNDDDDPPQRPVSTRNTPLVASPSEEADKHLVRSLFVQYSELNHRRVIPMVVRALVQLFWDRARMARTLFAVKPHRALNSWKRIVRDTLGRTLVYNRGIDQECNKHIPPERAARMVGALRALVQEQQRRRATDPHATLRQCDYHCYTKASLMNFSTLVRGWAHLYAAPSLLRSACTEQEFLNLLDILGDGYPPSTRAEWREAVAKRPWPFVGRNPTAATKANEGKTKKTKKR